MGAPHSLGPRPSGSFPVRLDVARHLSGGVQLTVGDRVLLLAPDAAVQMARELLAAAGVRVEFGGPAGGGMAS